MRTEEEVKEFLEELVKTGNYESLTNEQRNIIGRTLRWVLGLEKIIL